MRHIAGFLGAGLVCLTGVSFAATPNVFAYSGSLMAPNTAPLSCFSVSVAKASFADSVWSYHYQLTLKNNCQPSQIDKGVKVELQTPNAVSPGGLNFQPWIQTEATGGQSPVITFANEQINNPQTISVEQDFAAAKSAQQVNEIGAAIVKTVKVFAYQPEPPKKDGTISVSLGKIPAGWSKSSNDQYPLVTLSLNGVAVASHQFSDAWPATVFQFKQLEEPGNYTLSAGQANSAGHNFAAQTPLKSISLSASDHNQSVSFNYQQVLPRNGVIGITLPSQPGASGQMQSNQVESQISALEQIQVIDTSRQQPVKLVDAPWGKATTVTDLIPGDAYRTRLVQSGLYYVDYGNKLKKAAFYSVHNTVTAATAVNKKNINKFGYYVTNVPTTAVSYQLSGAAVIPVETKASLFFTGKAENGDAFSLAYQEPIDNKSHALELPTGLELSVAARNVEISGVSYMAKLDHAQIDPIPGLSTQKVNYVKQPAMKSLMVGYADFTSGTVPKDLITQAVEHGYNTIVIGFGTVDPNNQANLNAVSSAGWNRLQQLATDMANARSYAKQHNTNLRFLVSFGGAANTYHPSFSSANDPKAAQQVANAIVKNVMQIKVPGTSEVLQFNGADFDMEVGVSSEQLNQNLANVAADIKAQTYTQDGEVKHYLVSAAPQLNTVNGKLAFVNAGTNASYDDAIKAGDIDYLFVQEYNTPNGSFGGGEGNIDFVSASYPSMAALVAGTSTKIVVGEPANAYGATGTLTSPNNIFYSPKGNQQGHNEVVNQVAPGLLAQFNKAIMVGGKSTTMLQDSHFGGVMVWNINDAYTGGDYINPSAPCFQDPWALADRIVGHF